MPYSAFDPTLMTLAFDDKAMTEWFIKNGADPNAESRIKITPLSRAVGFYGPSFDIIETMFDIGGPTSNDHGYLLHLAVQRRMPDQMEVIKYLLDKGAARHINKLHWEDDPRLFAEQNIFIANQTPLHGAAMDGSLEVVRLLVAWGANPLTPDGKGKLAVEVAKDHGHDLVVSYLAPLSASSPKL